MTDRSAASRRGARRRRLRATLRDELTLRFIDGERPTVLQPHFTGADYRVLAKWVAELLPDYVIDAIEAAAK